LHWRGKVNKKGVTKKRKDLGRKRGASLVGRQRVWGWLRGSLTNIPLTSVGGGRKWWEEKKTRETKEQQKGGGRAPTPVKSMFGGKNITSPK